MVSLSKSDIVHMICWLLASASSLGFQKLNVSKQSPVLLNFTSEIGLFNVPNLRENDLVFTIIGEKKNTTVSFFIYTKIQFSDCAILIESPLESSVSLDLWVLPKSLCPYLSFLVSASYHLKFSSENLSLASTICLIMAPSMSNFDLSATSSTNLTVYTSSKDFREATSGKSIHFSSSLPSLLQLSPQKNPASIYLELTAEDRNAFFCHVDPIAYAAGMAAIPPTWPSDNKKIECKSKSETDLPRDGVLLGLIAIASIVKAIYAYLYCSSLSPHAREDSNELLPKVEFENIAE